MNDCAMKTKDCTLHAVKIARVKGYALRVCAPCAKVSMLDEYQEQVKRGVAFDRGAPTPGYEWQFETVPPPWGNDPDPRDS